MRFYDLNTYQDYNIERFNETASSMKSTYKNEEPESNIGDNQEEQKKPSGAQVLNRYDPSKRNIKEQWDPYFKKAVVEYMNYGDEKNINALCAMNESEQNSLLVSLTNKLYTMIVNKVDSIDYGEIPQSKGDITRLRHYDQLVECHEILRNIFSQYRERTEPVDVLVNARNNIENMKDIFMGGFAAKAEFPMSVYKTMTLAVVNATSFMIAVCIEYIKSPKSDGLEIVLDRTGIQKVKDHLVYESLIDFNEACKKGEVEASLRPLVKSHAQGFVMSAALGFKAVLILGGVLLAILPMIKDLVYFFFSTKARVSAYFDAQAKLIEMNANELRDNPDIKTQDDRDAVIRRQLKIAEAFRSISNALAIDGQQAEVKAQKEIKEDKRTYNVDEINPSENDGGSLF